MRFAALAFVVSACGFRAPSEGPRDGGGDAAPDALPVSPAVHFTQVTADVTELHPGLYGFHVTVVLQNDLASDLIGVGVSLTFADATADRARDFRWRDPDRRDGAPTLQADRIPAGESATYRFVVDALARAIPPGPILVDGSAVFTATGTQLAATPLDPPLALPFAAMNAPIVVDTVADQTAGTGTSLRQAIQFATSHVGINRITFDPAVFPPNVRTLSVLDPALGELPALTAGTIVIDGSGAGFVLAANASWAQPEGRYGLRLTGGTAVVAGIGFYDLAYAYRDEGDLSLDNCGPSGAQLEGGAIKVTGGTLVLDGNTFGDPDVGERNCFAASLRIHGGSGHRILNNRWTDQVMDTMFLASQVVEVSNNVMTAGANPSKTDECIYVSSQGGTDLWITGNTCVDMEYSAVVARGTEGGKLFIVHNTFVRDGRVDLAAVRREQATRAIVLRDNLYIGNRPAAILTDGTGGGFDIAFETVAGSPTCANNFCGAATIDAASMQAVTSAMVLNEAGTTPADFTPVTGSPLIDSATDWLDRNGTQPGRFNGAGPERGAVELP